MMKVLKIIINWYWNYYYYSITNDDLKWYYSNIEVEILIIIIDDSNDDDQLCAIYCYYSDLPEIFYILLFFNDYWQILLMTLLVF